jgi:hypothetical protein
MKSIQKILLTVATVMVFSVGGMAASQASVCSELRAACVYKNRLGEAGAGNCERYRATCGGGRNSCAQLRYQCMHKEALNLTGAGVCETYRANCR